MSVLKQMNHNEYPKSLKGKDDSSLRFIINDCRQAIAAMPNNPNNGYYQDEIHYCAMELAKRYPTTWVREITTPSRSF